MCAQPLLPSLWGDRSGIRLSDPFRSLQREIDRLFEGVQSDWGMPRTSGEVLLAPRVNVSETDAAITVTSELPGVEEKDVEVTFADGMLTIRGEKRAEKEEKTRSYHVMERTYGAFQRSIALPADVDFDQAKAEYGKGVLTVTLPKSPAAQTKVHKIAVKAA